MSVKSLCLFFMSILCITKFAGAQSDEEYEEPTMEIDFTTTAELEFPVDLDFESWDHNGTSGGILQRDEVSNGSPQTISVDFPDEEVRTIIRNAADMFDMNVVIPPELQGRNSLKLRRATWQEVFTRALDKVDFTFRQKGNIVYIESRSDAFIRRIREKTLFILGGALLLSISLNAFFLLRKPAPTTPLP